MELLKKTNSCYMGTFHRFFIQYTHTHFSYRLVRRQEWVPNIAVEWACFWSAFHLSVIITLQTRGRKFTDAISVTQSRDDLLCQSIKWCPYRGCNRGVEQVAGEVSRHSCVVCIFLPVRYCHNEGESSSVRADNKWRWAAKHKSLSGFCFFW